MKLYHFKLLKACPEYEKIDPISRTAFSNSLHTALATSFKNEKVGPGDSIFVVSCSKVESQWSCRSCGFVADKGLSMPYYNKLPCPRGCAGSTSDYPYLFKKSWVRV